VIGLSLKIMLWNNYTTCSKPLAEAVACCVLLIVCLLPPVYSTVFATCWYCICPRRALLMPCLMFEISPSPWSHALGRCRKWGFFLRCSFGAEQCKGRARPHVAGPWGHPSVRACMHALPVCLCSQKLVSLVSLALGIVGGTAEVRARQTSVASRTYSR